MNYNNSEFLASYGLSRQLPDSDRPEFYRSDHDRRHRL